MEIKVNMIEAVALAIVVLFVGVFLKRKIKFFERFCIPAPVIGGLLFSFITLAGYCTDIFFFTIEENLKSIFMLAFFTTIGYGASFKRIKRGSKDLVILMVLVVILIILQDIIAFAIAPVFDLHPLLALCTGSVSMVGGHGTALAWGPEFEKIGIVGASGVAVAAATFGLVAGSLIGGPIGRRLIERNKLLDKQQTVDYNENTVSEENKTEKKLSKNGVIHGIYQIALAMGIGSVLSTFLQSIGLLFPIYVGALVVAALLRNISDFSGKFKIDFAEIDVIGQACLAIFLSMALMTLKLWQLAELAVPMLVMLFAQILLMIMFAYFVIFRFLDKDYDSAVITAGVCGFGMGATPNAMANMEALTFRYRPSPKAFLIVPIVGVMFADIINSAFILILVNIFK
ncbi:MAG: sodium/glutamate symporter [Prevotellaceae bacterium]|jgi:ESS family glutamate:Na+ symporter|nr:sodium/glutamate symporter [Prevotellaceae bacterium]